jgi:hypothetical protein
MKHTHNTIFHVKDSFSNFIGTESLDWDDVKTLSNFYYYGNKLHIVQEIKKEINENQIYLTIVTPEGEFQEVMKYWINEYGIVIKPDDKMPPALYETEGNFLTDLSL